MKASKNLLLTSFNVKEEHFFQTRDDRNAFFLNAKCEAGLYCAIGGTKETDPNEPVWDLELFNGKNWVLQSNDANYSLIITNAGLEALAYVNEYQGEYRIRITAVKCRANFIQNPSKPIISWEGKDFESNDIILNTRDESINPAFSIANNLTWRFNMSNGGIQYCVKIDNETPGFVNGNKVYDYTVGAVGLYVADPNNQNEDVLFAVANLNTNISKYATTVNRIGNSIKLYLNTVLTNLGYVSDVTVMPEDVGSIPEVGNEADLQTLYPAKEAPYNLYLVDNLYSTNLPALAVRTGNPIDDNVGWTFFSPNDDIIKLDPGQIDDSLLDYMVATWDSAKNKYVPADADVLGKSENAQNQVKGIKIGNTLIFTGQIVNKHYPYSYEHSIVFSGEKYSAGERLSYTATSSNGESQKFSIVISNVDSKGSVTKFSVLPTLGIANFNDGADGTLIKDFHYEYGNGNGKDLQLRRKTKNVSATKYVWDFANMLGKPLYIGSGSNAGKIVTTETEVFLGWCTNDSVESPAIRLALDLRDEASYTDFGTTKYATDAETKNVKSNSSVSEIRAVVPKHLQNNYLQKTLVAGNPGDSVSNPVTVNTHVKFNETVVGKGVSGIPNAVDSNVSFFGLAYRAWWGDLAEFYEADEIYEPGTLITIGDGKAEITRAKRDCNGIISTAPGYELGEKKSAYDLPVALVGKVPVLMAQDCNPQFGDRIYLSKTEPGKASTIINGKCLGKIIDKSPELKNKISVMCSVKISF